MRRQTALLWLSLVSITNVYDEMWLSHFWTETVFRFLSSKLNQWSGSKPCLLFPDFTPILSRHRISTDFDWFIQAFTDLLILSWINSDFHWLYADSFRIVFHSFPNCLRSFPDNTQAVPRPNSDYHRTVLGFSLDFSQNIPEFLGLYPDSRDLNKFFYLLFVFSSAFYWQPFLTSIDCKIPVFEKG